MTTVLPVQPADWRVRAACVGKDPEIWHPVVAETAAGPTNAAMKAIIICSGCPVAGHCLDAAIQLGDQHGVWGLSQLATADRIREQLVGADR